MSVDEIIISLKGLGVLIDKDDNEIKIHFICYQKENSKIYGSINLINNDQYTMFKYFSKNNREFKIKGKTDDGYDIIIENVMLTRIFYKLGTQNKNPIEFVAMKFIISKKFCEIDRIRYGIINLNVFNLIKIEIKNGIIEIKPVERISDIVREINTLSTPKLTSYADIKINCLVDNLDNEINRINKELFRILELSSFAQGITQSYIYINCYKDDELLYGIYNRVKTRNQSFNEFIWSPYIGSYLKIAYKKYTDDLIKKTGLSLAMEWYIDSFSNVIGESKYIIMFNALERLIYEYKILKDKDEILKPIQFKNVKSEIKKEISKILKSNCVEKVKRGAIYKKLNELNRYALKDILNEYLYENDIGYSDIFGDFSKLYEIRNELIHRGVTDTKGLYDYYLQLTVLVQRIILSLFEYDGNEWINRLNDFSHEKFHKNPTNDWK